MIANIHIMLTHLIEHSWHGVPIYTYLDVICIAEPHLFPGQVLDLTVVSFFGHNRTHI